MAGMRALDQTLGGLIAKIDIARGDDDKIDAIVAVPREMTGQRTRMREQMMAMQSRMMEHMMSMPGRSGGMAANRQAPRRR